MPDLSVNQHAYLKKLKRDKTKVLFLRISVFTFFLLLWEAAARLQWIDSFIFCSPSRIFYTFGELSKDGIIYRHIGITLTETICSFFLSALFGILIAVLLWLMPLAARVAEPYLVVLNSLPKSALAPLLIVWLGANFRTIVVAGVSVALFGSILNLYTCFCSVSAEKEKLIYTLGGKRLDVLTKVVIPGTMQNIVSILKVNIGLCLVGVVIGEFIGSREGLGYLIIYGSQVYKLDWVLLSIVLLCIMAVCFYQLIVVLEKRTKK